MYNDNASEAPLYLVPNSEGTGKRLVRRPHPPPTTAPLPDDFDAITDTRDGTTVYSDAENNSALAIDYDDLTVAAPVYERPAPTLTPTPTGIHAPVPIPASRNPLATPTKQQRAVSPSYTLAGPDARSPPRGGDGPTYERSLGLSAGKARSVAGDRPPRRSLGPSGNLPPLAPPFSSGRGPAMGRGELVEKKVFEDGPERTISVWRENVAKKAGETGGDRDRDRGEREGDGRSEVDSHAGRRRVSTESRRRVESLAQVAGGSMKGKGHRSRESAEFTEVPHSSLQSPPMPSTPHANAPPTSSSQPTTPQKSQRRPPPTSPTVGPKGTEYSASVSDVTSQTKVASAIEFILSSCQPSLLHLLPILEELGVRRSEHMTALARMREETRDREVKEEALKKGVTVVEWAILIDKLQSL
ncbi:hypothetical protein BJV78DRAFT_1204796 [Lactifluus subvellereus]|nr:hypothetical protein BJV78DRAFT_1204796 [Lactifluus subvellereus]